VGCAATGEGVGVGGAESGCATPPGDASLVAPFGTVGLGVSSLQAERMQSAKTAVAVRISVLIRVQYVTADVLLLKLKGLASLENAK
jgi:hypothetical protein